MLNTANVRAPSHLDRIQTFELPHDERYRNATLALLGIDPAGQLAVEAFYCASECSSDPGDEWIAQFLFAPDGRLIECQDEECGRNAAFEPLSLNGFCPPAPVTRDIADIFDYAGDQSKPTFICRRLRIAYAIPLKHDADGLPYDYDTHVLYLAHLIDTTSGLTLPPALTEALASDIVGLSPMDALYDARSARLYVADGGDTNHPGAIHVFQLPTPVPR
jgi:hypothetical protein